MSLELFLGVLGLIVALLAVAAPYLWPNQKWIGWVALLCVGFLIGGSACLAFGSFIGGTLAGLIVLVAGAVWFWLSSRPKSNNASPLRVADPKIKERAAEYGDQRQRLYFGHIKVINPRLATVASNCEIRLVKIQSPNRDERLSDDSKPLKVTEANNSYSQSISSAVPGRFDLFGIAAESFPNTYLISNSDVPIFPILSTPEVHYLTYEISATGFQTTTAKIGLDLTGNPPPTNPANTMYSPSGNSVTTWITSSPQIAESDPIDAPLKWDPTPRIWIVEQGPA